MKQHEIIYYKQGEEEFQENFLNGIESGKDDSDAESDKLGSGNEFGKSNKNENSRQDTFRQEEILENRIFEDDDNSNEDKLDAEVNELVRSKNEFENSNEDSDSKQVEKFISSAEDINSTHTKNLDSEVEKVESQGTHSFNMKNALMILGASLVGVFAIAIFVAIYRHKKNQHKDQFIQGKMKSDHSFHIQPVLFDGDNEHYDMV